MLTSEGSHVASRRGYAASRLIEEGEAVPAGIPVGSWMKAVPVEPPVKAKAKAK